MPQSTMILQTTRIDGHRIRYAEARRNDAPSLILVSPQPQSILVYHQWWPTITDKLDVVAVDLPNHGGSDPADEIVSVSEQAAFFAHILDHFGLVNPHYVGPDVGTPMGLRFMADNPGRLKSAVMGDAGCVEPVSGAPLFTWLVYKPWVRRLIVLSGGRNYWLLAAKIGYRNYRPPKAHRDDYRNSVKTRQQLRNATGFIGSYPLETPRTSKDAQSIQTPVLVLHGQYATFIAADNSQRLARLLPKGTFKFVPEAAHFSYEDIAPAYMKAALDHIAAVEDKR